MKNAVLLLAAVAGAAVARFIPSVRIDHENRTSHACFHADIALGRPEDGDAVYVAFQNDSLAGIVTVRSDICFQKSTDAGRTWLAQDVLVRRGELFACYPDITVGPDRTIYIVFTERSSGNNGHFYCVRSTDDGATWSSPVRIDHNPNPVAAGWVRVVTDTAAALFCAWNDGRLGYMRIWSSRSTDRGETWRSDIRVDDDTVPSGCYHTDVAIQPGTNRYLVTCTTPYWVRPGYINSNSAFYSSTDDGETWSAGFVLDTFSGYCGQPHVVAGPDCIVCDYTGPYTDNQNATEARTSFDGGATWTEPVSVTDLDTLYSSYLNGAKLAIDATGRVHVSLMLCDLVEYEYNTYYAYSADHGLTWSERELVNDVTAGLQVDPNIAVDSAGYAYVVWQDCRNNRNEIWFSTNNTMSLADTLALTRPPILRCTPSPFRTRVTIHTDATAIAVLDAAGRLIRSFSSEERHFHGLRTLVWDGRDEHGRPSPAGVYLVRTASGPPAGSRIVRLE
jgi:hypothetical protein